jgi:predicted flavoprotein YhiN
VIRVNWTAESEEEWNERLLQLQGSAMLVANALKRAGLRERLADALCAQLGLQQRLVRELKKTERVALVQLLTSYVLPYTGHEGYKKAEVTGGGVPLSEVDCATLESRVRGVP